MNIKRNLKRKIHFLTILFAVLMILLIGGSSVFAADIFPNITGVTNGGVYNHDVTISFNDGANGSEIASAKLNDINFTSGSVVSAEGQYKLIIINKSGVPAVAEFKIDKKAPIVTSDITDDGAYSINKTIIFSDETNGSGGATAILNGAEISNYYLVSDPGTYTLVLKDRAGNERTISFKIDKLSPTLTGSGAANNGMYKTDVTVNVIDETGGSGIAALKLNDTAISNGYTVNTEGRHTLNVTDKAGNLSLYGFLIDKTSPIIQITDVGAYKMITFHDGANGSGIQSAKLDSTTTIENNYLIKAVGQHTVKVTDKLGNETTKDFIIDPPPVITNFSGNMLLNDADDDEGWRVYVGKLTATGTDEGSGLIGGTAGTIIKNRAGVQINNYFHVTHHVTEGELIIPEPGYYRVYIKDKGGNLSSDYLLFNWTGQIAPMVKTTDNTAPSMTISGPSDSEAIPGDEVEYTVTYSDDLEINEVILSSANISLNKTGTVNGEVVSVTGTGNSRKVIVKVLSGVGSLGIKIEPGTGIDVAGKTTPGAVSEIFTVTGGIPASVETVSIYRAEGEGNSQFAKVGHQIMISFTTNADLPTTPEVTVFGNLAIVDSVNGSGKNWTASYNVKASDAEGAAPFQIDIKDQEGNIVDTVISTTDNSSVTLDKTNPTCSSVILNGAYNTTSVTINGIEDALSGIDTTTLNENVFIDGDQVNNEGDYVLKLTDRAGNETVINFVIDRTAPVITNFSGNAAVVDAEEDWERYAVKLTASGTDDRSGLPGGEATTILKNDEEIEINNRFLVTIQNSEVGSPSPDYGTYRVYIKDRAGNISSNYLLFNWAGQIEYIGPEIN